MKSNEPREEPPTGRNPDLQVKRVRGMGRGVFAGRAFRVGQLIEACPVIVLSPGTEEETLGNLQSFVFRWGNSADRLAIALGYGSLYNHSPKPNAEFFPQHRKGEIEFRAIRPIKAGDQIFIDYYWEESDYETFTLPTSHGSRTD